MALGLSIDKAVFARALLLLEELRQSATVIPTGTTTLASTGGQLSNRVRRLLPSEADPGRTSGGWLTGMVLVVTLGIAWGLSIFASQLEDQPGNSQAIAPQPAPVGPINEPAEKNGGDKPALANDDDIETLKAGRRRASRSCSGRDEPTRRRRKCRVSILR